MAIGPACPRMGQDDAPLPPLLEDEGPEPLEAGENDKKDSSDMVTWTKSFGGGHRQGVPVGGSSLAPRQLVQALTGARPRQDAWGVW